MATKAERFKAEAQKAARTKNSPGPKTARPRPAAGKAAGAISGGRANPAGHNTSPRAAKNSSYELEVSATTRPSRKSTRKSPTHVKTDSSLRMAAMNKTTSPQARASRRSGD